MSPRILTPTAVRGIELFLMDVDGVLTDGRLYFGTNGFAAKSFHVRDGFGIALLHRAGVRTGIVSGREEDFVRKRAEDLGMAFIHLGAQDKASVVDEILARSGVKRAAVAYLGDDVIDTPAFARVGVSIAVHDAHPSALAAARYKTRTPGGLGAVREVADAILAARKTKEKAVD